jgi:translation initiation factor 1
MADNNWKERLGMVYSTNPDFKYETESAQEEETLTPGQQRLIVGIDRKGRAGKQVTCIDGFVGNTTDLETLAKMLKTKCGVGGTAKEGRILIQGDLREKIVAILMEKGYKAKRGN